MRSGKALKGVTIVLFLVLIAAFITYKTGALNHYLGSSASEPDSPKTLKPDTVRHNPAMMPTSKSMVAIPQEVDFPAEDSSQNVQQKPAKK